MGLRLQSPYQSASPYKPILIAPLLLSALSLIRRILPSNTLPNDAWQSLIAAAQHLAVDLDDLDKDPSSVPPSAQKPPKKLENSPSASPGQPNLVVKVTNNNHHADRDRRYKQTDREQHAKEVQLGLVHPPSNASKAETHAYEAITRGDKPDVAWILKQKIAKEEDKGEKRLDPTEDLMTTAASPYVTATSMLKHAQSLSNTMYRVAAVHIEYRWVMASYGRAYADKITKLEAQGVPRKECNGRAINTLIQMRTPGGKLDKSTQGALRLRLSRATRWYHAARTLSWGFLCLMPSEIAPKWVEQTLRVGEWALWLEVVKKVNPDTYKASQVLDAWLGADGIAGKPISGKETLFVKADVPMPSTQVEEVADSEEEGEVGDDKDGDESDGKTKPAPARSLRQLSLVDMFKPRE
ncbi:hypothetical protein DPSP01_014257 [Paraphaeosphaeria sporulosa]